MILFGELLMGIGGFLFLNAAMVVYVVCLGPLWSVVIFAGIIVFAFKYDEIHRRRPHI